MPTTDLISPFVVSCAGGLTLNKDVFSMQPGEALILQTKEENSDTFGPLTTKEQERLNELLIKEKQD